MILKGFYFGMILQMAVGPICLFIFQTAVTSGFLTALIGVFGIAIIDALYILFAIYGIGTLLNKREKLKKIIKYLGALVLVLFGLSNILGSFGISLLPSLNFLSTQSTKSVFLKVIVLTLSNPLTILFWIGVFSTKVSKGDMNLKEMYFFGSGAVMATVVFLTTISAIGSFVNNFLEPILLNLLNGIVGLIIIGFGMKIIIKND
jgi:threonine/homoserine/homoserine lactone efflux protein